MDEIMKMVIATAIRKMFQNGWLSISDIDQCLKLAGVIPMGRAYEILRTLHCVHFKDMPRELAEKIPALLTECFAGLNIDDLMKACEPAQACLGASSTKRLQ